MKKFHKISLAILIIIILFLIFIFSLSHIINKNNNYQTSITEEIQNNYQVDGIITYSNIYSNYYIFSTENKVIVLTKEYQKVLEEDLDNIADNPNNYELIYKTNTLMYEETILSDNQVTYNYYDAKTLELISSTTLEE